MARTLSTLGIDLVLVVPLLAPGLEYAERQLLHAERGAVTAGTTAGGHALSTVHITALTDGGNGAGAGSAVLGRTVRQTGTERRGGSGSGNIGRAATVEQELVAHGVGVEGRHLSLEALPLLLALKALELEALHLIAGEVVELGCRRLGTLSKVSVDVHVIAIEKTRSLSQAEDVPQHSRATRGRLPRAKERHR